LRLVVLPFCSENRCERFGIGHFPRKWREENGNQIFYPLGKKRVSPVYLTSRPENRDRVSFFSTVVRAIESTVLRHGYKVIVCNTDESIEMEPIHARALMEYRVDGIIVSPTANEKGEVSRAAKEIYGKQVHTVLFDRAIKGLKLPTIVSDNVAAANEATTHLIYQGHRRIGVLVGRRTLDSMTGRVEGYRGALLEHRIKFDETLVVNGIDVGVAAGYSAAKTLLDRKVRPTAIIVLNNLLVVGALNVIKEKGLMIPQDIAVIGWDDFDTAPHLQTPLTVVDQPAYSIDSIAAGRLMTMRSNESADNALHVVLKSKLVVRKSIILPPGF
jgi:DNA-binding LacI/PurR family transcriptional regulator